jgi:hypothetical protein
LSESTRNLILVILILLLFLAIAFLASNYLMRRAIKRVIKILRDAGAVSLDSAQTVEQLGLKKSMFQFKLWRDYKPAALQLLLTANVVIATEDGKLFLSEDNLSKTKLGQQ